MDKEKIIERLESLDKFLDRFNTGNFAHDKATIRWKVHNLLKELKE